MDHPALLADLELAQQVQQSLLPAHRQSLHGWKVDFAFEPFAHVSGDYVDIISGPQSFHFLLGDVSGKGVAASMLMSHLHATMRALLSTDLPLEQVVAAASRAFCHSSLPAQFATLLIGRADRNGSVELLNAGHTPLIYSSAAAVHILPAGNIPLGLFCESRFAATRLAVSSGDTLLLHTDGITESCNADGEEFGVERLQSSFAAALQQAPDTLISHIRRDLAAFTSETSPPDDLTLLTLQRT
ncbi:MAG: PP2C family protein-serine/threonine phosphatase [Acidobacteriaceae bacterium]